MRFFSFGNDAFCLCVIQFSSRNRRIFQDEKKEKFNEIVNSLDDCIEGIEEPLYGFVTRVKFTENQPCTLGVTCKRDGKFV